MHRASSFFVRALVSGAAFLPLVIGCNAKLATVLSSEDPASSPGADASYSGPSIDGGIVDASTSISDCKKLGGVCLPKGESAPPTYKPSLTGQCTGTDVCWVPEGTTSPTGQACVNDQDCNPSPEISALHGQCFHGICVCNIGSVQASGKCGSTITDCVDQGGTCHQQPATCPTGKIKSNESTNMTCGDFVEAVCCHDPAKCKGPAIEVAGSGWVPVDFVCCAPNDAAVAPICVNGWLTCPANHAPVDKSKGGCG
jgi:hypothetical protein